MKLKYLITLIPYVLMYLIGSFIYVSFNPAEWVIGGRAVLAVVATILTAPFIVVLAIEESLL